MRPSHVQSRTTAGPSGAARNTTSWVNSSWMTTSTTIHDGDAARATRIAVASEPPIGIAARRASAGVDIAPFYAIALRKLPAGR